MKNLLISTMGKKETLFRSLKQLVDEKKIAEAVYLVSLDQGVEKNFSLIKNYNEKLGIKTERITINDPERIEKILNDLEKSGIKEKAKSVQLNHGKVYLDYTYGTKALAAASVHFFLINELVDEMIYVSGTRDRSGMVIDNFQGMSSLVRRLFFHQHLNQVKTLLQIFDFETSLVLIKKIFSESNPMGKALIQLIQHFIDFFQGRFGRIKDHFLDPLAANLEDFDLKSLRSNNQFIDNYLGLKNKKGRDLNDSKQMLVFEIEYLADLMKIFFLQKKFPQVLAIFNSLVDKYLTIKLIEKGYQTKEIAYQPAENNFMIKTNGKEVKPLGVSLKLDACFPDDQEPFKMRLKEMIQKRNNSLFGHGFYFPDEKDGAKALELRKIILDDLKLKPRFNGFFFYYPINIDLASITP